MTRTWYAIEKLEKKFRKKHKVKVRQDLLGQLLNNVLPEGEKLIVERKEGKVILREFKADDFL